MGLGITPNAATRWSEKMKQRKKTTATPDPQVRVQVVDLEPDARARVLLPLVRVLRFLLGPPRRALDQESGEQGGCSFTREIS